MTQMDDKKGSTQATRQAQLPPEDLLPTYEPGKSGRAPAMGQGGGGSGAGVILSSGMIVPPSDAVVIQRRLLKNGKFSRQLAFGETDRPFPVYPYTKGQELVNDGISYGEILEMSVFQAPPGTDGSTETGSKSPLEDSDGFSRRTRSGRQVIDKTDPGLKKQ
jgi:hypothetical protein